MSVLLLALLHQRLLGEDSQCSAINMRMARMKLQTFSSSIVAVLRFRCSANFTNISVSRNSRSAGHTIAIECPLCAKTGSGPVLVGVGREDGLGPLRGTILLVLVVFSDIPWRQ